MLADLHCHIEQGFSPIGLARKLVVIMHAMLRSGELFNRTTAAA
jgi:hypothetical protein